MFVGQSQNSELELSQGVQSFPKSNVRAYDLYLPEMENPHQIKSLIGIDRRKRPQTAKRSFRISSKCSLGNSHRRVNNNGYDSKL
jgi:hypothetical protein